VSSDSSLALRARVVEPGDRHQQRVIHRELLVEVRNQAPVTDPGLGAPARGPFEELLALRCEFLTAVAVTGQRLVASP
jgi:hypothetical protein